MNEDSNIKLQTPTVGLSTYDTTPSDWIQLVAGFAAGRNGYANIDAILREATAFADKAMIERNARFPLES